MTLAELGTLLFPEWLRDWIQYHILARFGITPYQIMFGMVRGVFDFVLFLFVGLGLLTGGETYMSQQYTLSPDIQATVLKWAPVADNIARRADIPREVPLVLWFKEAGMQPTNPELCTGIIGAYDLVQSGERPCFTPGPISDIEVSEQLVIGAREFKKRCPDITYYTYDADTIKRCYFAYNAGVGAANRLSADESAYVMNNYDAAHRNMIYSDIVLGTVRVRQLGAWPTHLAFQSLITTAVDEAEGQHSLGIALLDTATRIYDWLAYRFRDNIYYSTSRIDFPAGRSLGDESCLSPPAVGGDIMLRPTLNPVTAVPFLTQDVHGCRYALPGIDISSNDRTAVLQAPMPGEVTTYTDQWYNTTIRIENDEWVVLMLHPRSYLVPEGDVRRGQAVGIMGAVGNATGPHVHYTIYDKLNESYVDPALFLP